MSRLQIKAESTPKRCEICHKSDRFDPIFNHCSRCAGLTFSLKPIQAEPVITVTPRMFIDILIGSAKLGTVAGTFISGIVVFILITAPSPPEAFLVLAILSGIGGPLMGIFCGLCLNLLIVMAKWTEFIHGRIRNLST